MNPALKRRCAIALGVVIGLPLLLITLCFVAGDAVVSRMERNSENAWQRELSINPRSVLAAVPVQGMNDAARQINAVSTSMGFALEGPRDVSDDAAALARRNRLSDEADLVNEFNRKALAIPNDEILPPDARTMEALDRKRPNVTALARLILRLPLAQWSMDLRKGVAAPGPHSIAVLRLHRLMVAEALDAIRTGDEITATELLTASVRLNESMRHRPELILRSFATSVERIEMGALRKMRRPPTSLDPFIVTPQFSKEEQLRSFAMESLPRDGDNWIEWRRENDFDGRRWIFRTAPRHLLQLAYRACEVDFSRKLLENTKRLLAAPDPCRVTDRGPPLAWWSKIFYNELGNAADPYWSRSWRIFSQFELDRELTRNVVLIKRGGQADIIKSFCRESAWKIDSRSIELQNPPPRNPKYKDLPPWRWERRTK